MTPLRAMGFVISLALLVYVAVATIEETWT